MSTQGCLLQSYCEDCYRAVKGQDSEKDKTKREYLDEWVKAVNEDGRFGGWTWDIAFTPSDVRGVISKIMKVRSLTGI
jgi:hypothetical protein